ncbi:MAG: hypothetical protein MSC30_06190 [Gaiellaceae bacterium MAG52_C11]|nr:hypothetical protein [Candidatus Gaiellasilicea maunaloa]
MSGEMRLGCPLRQHERVPTVTDRHSVMAVLMMARIVRVVAVAVLLLQG